VFLVIGLASSLATTWIIAFALNKGWAPTVAFDETVTPPRWHVDVRPMVEKIPAPTPPPRKTIRSVGWGYDLEITDGDNFLAHAFTGNARVGWPVRSLQWFEAFEVSRPLEDLSGVRAGVRLQGRFSHVFGMNRLPLIPVWPGFLIGVALHAGAWWLADGLRRWAVRSRRTRRGRCPSCGYDLSGFETCPECGRTAERSKGTRVTRSP